tara:strand:+ start:620 stop:1096 length:477 start_codon:yes stop_codon:yes gene_type:complete
MHGPEYDLKVLNLTLTIGDNEMNEWTKMAYDQKWLDQQPSDVWEVVTALKQQLTLEAEETVRDLLREVGRAEARRECNERGEPYITEFNKVARSVYYYDSLSEAISFAESLGWVDQFGDAPELCYGEWSPAVADSCEAEVLEYIKSKGYRVINYTEEV